MEESVGSSVKNEKYTIPESSAGTARNLVRGVLITALGGICWGSNGTLIQYLYSRYEISGSTLTCVRAVFGGLLLLLLGILKRDPGVSGVPRDRENRLTLFLYASFGLAFTQFAYTASIRASNAGTATVLQNLSMIFTLAVSCLLARRLPDPLERICVALALTGGFLVATEGSFSSLAISPEGLFWGIMNAAAVTGYTMLPGKLLKKWSPLAVLGWGMMIGGALLTIIFRPWEEFQRNGLPAGEVLLLALIVVVGISGYALFTWGVSLVGPVCAGMVATTEPLTAAVLAAALLHTRFSLPTLVGFACILLTVFLLSRGGTEETAPDRQT